MKKEKKRGSEKESFMNQRGIEMDMLAWWLIGLVALVILILAIMVLRGKGAGALEFIKDLFRFKSTGLGLCFKDTFSIQNNFMYLFIILINNKKSLRILFKNKIPNV